MKFLILSAVSLFGLVNTVYGEILAQNFNKKADVFLRIDESGIGELPRTTVFTTTPTGWKWGGYADDSTGYRVELDRIALHGMSKEDVLIFKKNPSKCYAYTIFSSKGENIPDKSIDISKKAKLKLKVADSWNGWFGGGDNGTGLVAPANEVRATILRLMIRDGKGIWYISGPFALHSVEDNSLDGKISEFKYDLKGMKWYKINDDVNTSLNALAAKDELTMSYSSSAGSPDLTKVGGMGIYVQSAYKSAQAQLAFKEISLIP